MTEKMSGRRAKVGSLATAAIAVIASIGLMMTFHAAPARAQCAGSGVAAGYWKNTNPTLHWIGTIKLRFDCNDTQPVSCNNDSGCHNVGSEGPSWWVRIWSCYPDNCPWGAVPLDRAKTGVLLAKFDQPSVVRYVRIFPSKTHPNLVKVRVHSVFKNGAADQWWHAWFSHKP